MEGKPEEREFADVVGWGEGVEEEKESPTSVSSHKLTDLLTY